MSEGKSVEKDGERRTVTVLGSETEFDGVLEFSDTVIVTGKFNGKICSSGNLEVVKGAVCTVEKITAKSVVISGSVTGEIEASERVEICSGGSVSGNIATARIRIESNVDFNGQVTMLDEIPDESLFASASQEYKQSLVLRSDVIE